MVSEVSLFLKLVTFSYPPPQELKKYGVTTVVRVCEATYDTAPVEKEGIQVLVSSVEAKFNTNPPPHCPCLPTSNKKKMTPPC